MTHSHPNRTRRLLAAVLAAAGLAAALVLGTGAAPAAAHDGDAVVVIEETHPAGMSVHYIVRVTWANDGHPAAGATVTATAVNADGTQLTPVPLQPADDDGRYSGALEYPSPGNWTVRVTAVEPTGSVEQDQVVAPPPTTAEQGSEGATATTAGDDGFAPADDGTGAGSEQAASDGDSGSGMPVLLIVAAAVVVIGGAVAAAATIRRQRSAAGPAAERNGSGDPGEPAPAGEPLGATGAPAGGDGAPGDA